jgi:hypothetical protein
MTLALKACRCGAPFVGAVQARWCPGCKRDAMRAASKARSQRWRAERRGPLDRACRQCAASFTPKRSTGVYCSNACRALAYRAGRRAIGLSRPQAPDKGLADTNRQPPAALIRRTP